MPPETGRIVRRAKAMAIAGAMPMLLAASLASTVAAEQRRPPLQEDADCSKCHPAGGRKFTTEFTREFHRMHGGLQCRECHQVEPHGALRLNAQRDCTSCHHDPQYHARCPQCHPAGELPDSLPMTQSLRLSVWDEPRERSWPFRHSVHVGALACADCHHDAPAYHVTVDCAGCHDQHHSAQTRCNVCHGDEVLVSHERSAHVACATSGCHSFENGSPVSANRSSCVLCHGEQDDHQPGRNCVTCHVPSGHRFPIRSGR